MTAKEARETALNYNTSTDNIQYVEIKTSITSLSKKGKYEMSYYKMIHQDVINKLKMEGYDVYHTPGDQREGPYIMITW